MGIRHDVPAIRASTPESLKPTDPRAPPPPPPPDWDRIVGGENYKDIRSYYNTLTQAQRDFYFYDNNYNQNITNNAAVENALEPFEQIGNIVIHPVDTVEKVINPLTSDTGKFLIVAGVAGIFLLKTIEKL
jgi:hypothetical protein